MMAPHPPKDQPTLDQRRAAYSMERVKNIEHQYPSTDPKRYPDQDRYADYVERLPAAILTNGLGQALAQLLAAARRANNPEEDPHYLLYQDVSSWLCREDADAPFPREKDILEAITHGGRKQYMQAVGEALAWLEWHKKLAVAYLKRPEGEN